MYLCIYWSAFVTVVLNMWSWGLWPKSSYQKLSNIFNKWHMYLSFWLANVKCWCNMKYVIDRWFQYDQYISLLFWEIDGLLSYKCSKSIYKYMFTIIVLKKSNIDKKINGFHWQNECIFVHINRVKLKYLRQL